jgi:DNA replication protein DnaC
LKPGQIYDFTQLREKIIGAWPEERPGVIDPGQAEFLERRRIDDAMTDAGIAPGTRFRNATLDNYETPTNNHKAALDACRDICAKFSEGKGVVLFGEPGGGKTHLLVGMLREAAKAGLTIRYATAEDYFSGMRSREDVGLSERQYVESFVRPAVLAFDDLQNVVADKSRGEDSFQKRMLWSLLDKRYMALKSTITATNRDGKQLRELLDERITRRFDAVMVRVSRVTKPKN